MNMKSLIAKMDQLSQVDEAKKKKPDADGDGVPDWADKKPGEDDHKEKVDETSEKMLNKMKDNDLFKARREAKAQEKKEKEAEKVDEAIAIQADGQEAMALLDMLKLAGQPAPQMAVGGCGMTEADRDPSYANTPDEEVADISAATPTGNDMHREKEAWRAAAGADNPMVAAMEGKLAKMFEAMDLKKVNEVDVSKMPLPDPGDVIDLTKTPVKAKLGDRWTSSDPKTPGKPLTQQDIDRINAHNKSLGAEPTTAKTGTTHGNDPSLLPDDPVDFDTPTNQPKPKITPSKVPPKPTHGNDPNLLPDEPLESIIPLIKKLNKF